MATVIIQGATYDVAEVEQAQKLIFAGKTFATAGDPRLQRLVNNLLEMGVQSAQQKVAQAKALEQQKLTIMVNGQGFSVRPEDRPAFIEQQIESRGGDVTFQTFTDTERITQTYRAPTTPFGDPISPFEQQTQRTYDVSDFDASRNLPGGRETISTSTTATTPSYEIKKPGTIYEVQTGTFKVPGKSKHIPVTKTYIIGESGSSRVATKEEREYLGEVQQAELWKDLILEKTDTGELIVKPAPSRLQFYYSETKGKVKDFASEELLDETKTKEFFTQKSTLPGGAIYEKISERVGGIFYGAVGTKGDLLRTGVIVGATAGVGFAVQGITKGATYGATALFGSGVGAVTGTTLKLGTIGAGVYFGGKYVKETTTRIYEAPTDWEKGKITGRATADVLASVYGFRTGVKGFDMLEGLIRTRGRTFIDIPQGEYPTAPTRTHLKSFRENIYLQLGIKPGAFHTTGETFWKGGRITPTKGTSELPGLYGSTKISTPFARISGSSSTAKFDSSRWIQSLLTPPGKPGVAYLQPEGFRYSPAKPGKWYWSAKPGYADVPGIKTEIEAIFRPGAGSYTISSKGYYTDIKGVRVPIDSFVYDPSIISTTQTGGLNLAGGQPSYSGYTQPSYVNPTAGLSLVSTSTTKTTPSVSLSTSYSSVVSSIPSSSSIVSSSKPVSSSRVISKSYSSIMSSIAPSSSIKSSAKPSSKSSISKLYSSIVPSSVRKSYKYSYGYYYKKPPVTILPKFKPRKQKRITGRYDVFGRRQGKFRRIGKARTERGAFALGKKFLRDTLGATIKVPKSKRTRLPGFRTKITKEGTLFIEPRKRRLKRGGREVKEIQLYKQAHKQAKRLKLPTFKAPKLKKKKKR